MGLALFFTWALGVSCGAMAATGTLTWRVAGLGLLSFLTGALVGPFL